MVLWLLLACAADSTGPATPGSVLAQEVATAEKIATLSGQIEAGAAAIQKQVGEARTKALTPEERKVLTTDLERQMAAIETLDKELQEAVVGVELRVSAGVDPHARGEPGETELPDKKPVLP